MRLPSACCCLPSWAIYANFADPTAALLDYLTSRCGAAEAGVPRPGRSPEEDLQDLLLSGLMSAKDLLQAHQATAPAGRQAALSATMGSLDRVIQLDQAGTEGTAHPSSEETSL